MKISLLTPQPLQLAGSLEPKQAKGLETSFSEQLRSALNEVNSLQVQADEVTNKYLIGDIKDLHQVMLATEEANLALQLTISIRNKIIEAYQEMSRMQI
ncbi:MAG: flagellar hook-basal body complex protein FliE [Bacillota bacterium]